MKWIWLFMCLSVCQCQSQTDSLPMVILPGEKTPKSHIGLDEVVVYQPVKLNSFEELKKYMLLRRRVIKVYPYAKLASERFVTLKERLDHMDNRRQKKRYAKMIEKVFRWRVFRRTKKANAERGSDIGQTDSS